jgi:hypothetical protein
LHHGITKFHQKSTIFPQVSRFLRVSIPNSKFCIKSKHQHGWKDDKGESFERSELPPCDGIYHSLKPEPLEIDRAKQLNSGTLPNAILLRRKETKDKELAAARMGKTVEISRNAVAKGGKWAHEPSDDEDEVEVEKMMRPVRQQRQHQLNASTLKQVPRNRVHLLNQINSPSKP